MTQRSRGVLWRLTALAVPYRGWLGLTLLSILLSGVLMVATPWLVGYAINLGFADEAGGSVRTLVVAVVLLLAAAVARSIVTYYQGYLAEQVSQYVAYDLRNRLYDHLQRLSFAYHDSAETGQVMSRATQDVEAVRFFVSMGLMRALYVVALLIATAVMMLATNVLVALVALVFVPITGAIAIHTSRKMRPGWMAIQNIQGDLANVLQENLTGQRVVKAFAREEHEQAKFSHQAHRLFDASYRSNQYMAFADPLMASLWLVSLALVFWVGGREVIAGRMQAGDIITFQLYLTMLQVPVRSLGWIVGIFSRAQSAGARIFDLLDTRSAVTEQRGAVPLRPGPGEVRFDHVGFRYGGGSAVLADIDIHARPGEVIALLGPTGSGKSTVVNLLPRFYDVTEGAITIDGQDIREVTLDSLREAIGIVQQDVFLFSATIRDNIAYGQPDATIEEVEAAARAARIHEFIAGLPDGYDTWVGERGITLSGGQKQRVAIARTLLLNPRVLVLDDATSSVDTRTEYLIQGALETVMEGRTTFVIAQRLRTVRRADQIIVLRDGRIEERGTHEELLARNGLYRQIYDLELRDQEEAALTAVSEGGA